MKKKKDENRIVCVFFGWSLLRKKAVLVCVFGSTSMTSFFVMTYDAQVPPSASLLCCASLHTQQRSEKTKKNTVLLFFTFHFFLHNNFLPPHFLFFHYNPFLGLAVVHDQLVRVVLREAADGPLAVGGGVRVAGRLLLEAGRRCGSCR
eukprot:PhM_4_TR4639/c0_g3_i1/m.99771